MATSASLSNAAIAAIPAKVNHVFLPRRLPGKNDEEAAAGLAAGMFVDDMLATANSMGGNQFVTVTAVLRSWAQLQGEKGNHLLLSRQLNELESGGVVPFLVRGQNALLIFERCGADSFLIHASEILPENAQAFTGACVEWPVPQATFKVPTERLVAEKVVEKIVELASKTFPDCMPTTTKKGVKSEEIREPPFAKRLFEWLLPVLCVDVVDPVASGAKRLVKKLRHQVSYKNSRLPWTRSMEWAAVKAVCHWVATTKEGGNEVYKCIVLRYMTELLAQGMERLDNDLEQNLKAKIARRAKKLQGNPSSRVVQGLLQVCLCRVAGVKKRHDELWAALSRTSERLNLDEQRLPSMGDIAHDVRSIQQLCESKSLTSDGSDWEPPIETMPSNLDALLEALRSKPDARCACRALIDIENWVLATETPASELSMADTLHLMKSYYEEAVEVYKKDPEGFSRLVVTLYRLAVFADQTVVRSFPLVGTHEFELDLSILSGLLAPSRRLMEIVHEIEEYVAARNRSAPFPSLVSGDTSAKCFAYRYATQCGFGQHVEEIQRDAQATMDAKRQEVSRAKGTYDELMTRYQTMNCSNDYWGNHRRSCARCSMHRQAYALTCGVFEMPLPEQFADQLIVVFELRAPSMVKIFRDVLVYVTALVRRPLSSGIEVKSTWQWHQNLKSRRLTHALPLAYDLRSSTKRFVRSHYRSPYISQMTSVEDYIKPNGANLCYGEEISGHFVSAIDVRAETTLACTLKTVHSSLQPYVNSTTHVDSEVIANQNECPASFALNEFKEFGFLRAGVNLQLMNLCRAFVLRSLPFGNGDVFKLVAQMMWQTERQGGDFRRVAFREITNDRFVIALVGQISLFLRTHEKNWEQAGILRVVITIATRLVVMSDQKTLAHASALELIRFARQIGVQWIEMAQSRYEKAMVGDVDVDTVRKQKDAIVNIAMATATTYLVDDRFIGEVLESSDDICTWVVALNAIQRHHNQFETMNNKLRRVLACAVELWNNGYGVGLDSAVLQEGCTTAIERLWEGSSGGKFAAKWTIHCRGWLWTTFTTLGGGGSRVWLNMMTGEFRINDRTIGTLPTSVTSHRDFIRTFGSTIIVDSQPTTRPSEYLASYRIKGLLFRFCVDSSGGLTIIYTTADGAENRLVPFEHFQHQFPSHFSEFSHWQTQNEVKFRPSSVFHDDFSADRCGFVLELSSGSLRDPPREATLVNFQSFAAKAIYASGIGRMDTASHCHIWVLSGAFEVDLHRLGMVFEPARVDGNAVLRWKQNRDYYISSRQGLGCLIGLEFGLALETSADATAYRKLLLPGFALHSSIQRTGTFKYTVVTPDYREIASAACRYFEFDVAEELQELKAHTHESWLMLALLHMLTSNVVADPFTARTGLDVAMTILQSARCFVNVPLSGHAVSLLRQIADLAPTRTFYPKHLKSMEVVLWSGKCLDYAASDDLLFLADRIVAHSNHFGDFFKRPGTKLSRKSDTLLTTRAHFRAKQFYGPNMRLSPEVERQLGLETPANCKFQMRSSFGNTVGMREVGSSAFLATGNPATPSMNHHDFVFSKASPVLEGGNLVSESQVWWRSHACLNEPSKWLMWVTWALGPQTDDVVELALGCSWLFLMRHNDRLATDLYRIAQLKTQLKEAGFSSLPSAPFHTEWGYTFNKTMLTKVIQAHLIDLDDFHELRGYGESYTGDEVKEIYRRETRALEKMLVSAAKAQWPSAVVSLNVQNSLLTSTTTLMDDVKMLWANWLKNRQLHEWLQKLDRFLQRFDGPSAFGSSLTYPTRWTMPKTCACEDPPISHDPVSCLGRAMPVAKWESLTDGELETTFVELKTDYETLFSRMNTDAMACSREVAQQYDAALLGRMPSRSALLQSLVSSEQYVYLRNAILEAGEICTWMQWIKRLVLLRSKRTHFELRYQSELENAPHVSWDPKETPEWLLLEIECDFSIRSLQMEIAHHLLENHTQSIATQLNMGEGKTHVIVPMLLATLSDKSQLATLTVLRQLLDTNYSALVQKLGGLLSKRVHYLPYARDLNVNPERLQREMATILANGDVLITCPEFRLSSYLKALEEPGKNMPVVRWMESNLRHVVDESDEAFKTNFQLVYAKGAQQPLDADAMRWKATATVFEAVKRHSKAVHATYPNETELSCNNKLSGDAQFPHHFRIIDISAYEELRRLVVDDLLCGNCADLGLQLLTADLKVSVREFVLNGSLSMKHLDDALQVNEDVLKTCLVLRGLLAFEVLYFALSKRYRVEYGVREVKRESDGEEASFGGLAVPFRAKDVPSERADFGHPDVAICLTFLSYYYSGLNERQMYKLLTDLKNSVNGEAEMRGWLAEVPGAPTDLASFNLVDAADLRSRVYPAIQFNQRAITYYLSTYVFPREAKQFPHRLSASAWDLAQSGKRVVGFSGTNDTCELLPLQIRQNDLPKLSDTNALVDSYLLRAENNVYRHLEPNATTADILDLIRRYDNNDGHPVQVLLDVGALLLDKSNSEVGAMWMAKSPQSILGAVYFEKNEIVVLDRRGGVTPFALSGLRHSLGHCVVYLDDSHTRGTDLPIPAGVRACVTVGSSQTRDRLVQGCMRMRMLKNGHRLMFVTSHMVHLELQKLHPMAPISPKIIVDWCHENSIKFITNHLTMWSANGAQFVGKREEMAIGDPSDDSFLEEEVLKLASMYGMERKKQPLKDIAQRQVATVCAGVGWRGDESFFVQEIVDRVGRLSQGGAKQFAQVLGEEQERQLEPEQEDERERELPPPKKALRPVIHPFIVRLARAGAWPPHSFESDAITSFPMLFRQTTAASHIFEKDWTDRQIYLTKEFTRTVALKVDDQSDFYLRAPVWMIWLHQFEVILFISPFEVNALWDDFKKNTKVALSPVAARLRPSQTMMFVSPSFCMTCVHSSPESGSEAFLELMLAVGTLYLGSQRELDDCIEFLGLCPHPRTEAQTRHYDAQRIAMSGFVAPNSRTLVAERLQRCRFSQDPTPIARQICRLFGWAHLLPHSHAGELLDNVTRLKVEAKK